MINLRRIDLNLLVTLDVLLAEQNVTRTAERLHMSQPEVSVHLAKLRDLLGDPLLLPGPRGMRPTTRAEALREPLREALESLSRAVAPAAPFDPANADLTWRIAATDYTESTHCVASAASHACARATYEIGRVRSVAIAPHPAGGAGHHRYRLSHDE